jgi:hypothetical protein
MKIGDMIDKWGHKIHKTYLTQGSPIRDPKMVVTITAENWLLAANHPICSIPASQIRDGARQISALYFSMMSLAHHKGSIFCIKTLKKTINVENQRRF